MTKLLIFAILLWLPGFMLTTPARPVRIPMPVTVLGLGLISIAVGALQWSLHLIQAFAALAGVPAKAKPASLIRSLDFARAHFEIFARMSRFTIAGIGVVAVARIVLERGATGDSDPRPARPTLAPRSGTTTFAVTTRWRDGWWRSVATEIPWS